MSQIEKRRFEFLNERKDVEKTVTNLAEQFTLKEYLTEKDIQKTAEILVQNIQDVLKETTQVENRTELILYLLNIEHVFDEIYRSKKFTISQKELPRPVYADDTYAYLKEANEVDAQNTLYAEQGLYTIAWNDEHGIRQHGDLQRDELQDYLFRIRQSVLEKVKDLVNADCISIVDRALSENQRVWSLHEGKVFKSSFDHNRNYDPLDPQEKEMRNIALTTLYSLPERSPFLTYQVTVSDFDTRAHEGFEIHKKLSMTTLQEILATKPLLEYSKVTQYLTDAIKGAAFLVANNLRLTDLTPHNIAVNYDTESGMLFDYDGLRTSDQPMEGYMTHMGFAPPERIPLHPIDAEEYNINDPFDNFIIMHSPPPPQITKPISEAEMVYELGMTLGRVCEVYPNESKELSELAKRMRSQKPDNRPTLESIIDELDSREKKFAS